MLTSLTLSCPKVHSNELGIFIMGITGQTISLLKIYKNHHAKWETWMMMWGDDSEYSSGKRWPLGSPGAIKD